MLCNNNTKYLQFY